MDIRFNDSDIITVTDRGIALSGGQFLDYTQCAANFRGIHGGSGKCVGKRDVTVPSIVFYTAPRTVIVFGKRGWFQPSPVNRFHALIRQITHAGYTTRDES